jgi:hypothetical protein
LPVSAVHGADGGTFALTISDVRLEIDAERGGRVVTLSLAGRNLLSGPEIDIINFGSTFWTSPQSDWGWPPVAEIDSAAYAASLDGQAVVVRGPACEGLGVSVDKRFEADPARHAFVVTYTIVNRRGAAVRVAPWEVTRVQPNGLTFFVTGGGPYEPSDLPARELDGVTWVHHDQAVIRGHQKLFADTPEGWIAHLDGDALLVKSFPHVARDAQAPGEAQVEIYASSLHRYVEVEQQGAYEELPAGASRTWQVEWRVRRLPVGVPRELGSSELVRFVRAVVAAGAAGGEDGPVS